MWLLKCTWNFRNFKLEFLFNSKPPSLGPRSTQLVKKAKNGVKWYRRAKRAQRLLGDGERAAEPGDMPVSGIMLWLAKPLYVYRFAVLYRALSMSRSYYSETIQISLLDFAHPSAPRRETNIYLWSVRKRKTRPSKCGFFLYSPVRNNGHIFTKRLTYI